MKSNRLIGLRPAVDACILTILCTAAFMVIGGRAEAQDADSLIVVNARFAAGQTANIPIRIVNLEELKELSVPLEVRAVTPGAFITSLGMVFQNRITASELPDVVRRYQYDTASVGACSYDQPAFTNGGPNPVSASPVGMWFFRSGDALVEFLDPAAPVGPDPEPAAGSMSLIVDLTAVPGTFEIDTICVEPGGPSDRLRFINGDGFDRTVVFQKGTVRINAPPIARDTTITVVADQTVLGTVFAVETDPGDELTYTLSSPPSAGSVIIAADGSFEFHAPLTDGITTFEFQVSDGLASDIGTVTVNIQPLTPDTLYVRKNGSDITGDGSSANPFKTISHAIALSTHGDLILVGPGIYDQPGEVPVVFPNSHKLTIRSESGPFQTELVGTSSASGSVVVMDAPDPLDTLSLIGFTIRDNVLDNPGCVYCGGGITVAGMTVARIMNCIIRDNTATGAVNQSTGGILFSGAGGRISNNWIVGNEGLGDPSAIGGLKVGASANISIFNNTVALNEGPIGGGTSGAHVQNETSLAQFDNNIIAFNAPGVGLRAASILTGSETTINNLYFGNDGDAIGFPDSSTWVRDNPFFVDTGGGDFHITCPSAARNGGEVGILPPGVEFDIDGQLRVPSSPPPRIDIGADQFYDADKNAAFTPDVDSGCAPLTVSFSNQSTCADEQWVWTFGDGGSSGAKSPIHEFQNPGVYEVRLIALGVIDADTTYDTILVQGPVVPDFTSDVIEGCIPFNVTFTASANGNVGFYTWDFGDGNVDTGTVVIHTFTTAARRSVTVTAHNTCGSFPLTKPDYIFAKTTPTIGITSSFDTVIGAPCNPFAVQFEYSSDYKILAWNWDFGDNHTSTDSMPLHVYNDGDTFSVRLIATGECGPVQVVRSGYIKLRPRPIASASAAPSFACVGITQVNFTGSVTGNFNNSFWVFGDGSTAPGPSASHLYTQIGRYLPRLVVVSSCGQDTIPLADSLTVGSLPAAAFAVNADSGYEQLAVSFTDQSTNLPTSWLWRYGDNITSTQRNPIHTYVPGVYFASHIVSNPCGIDTSTARRIAVGSYRVTITDSLGTSGDTVLYTARIDTLVIGYDHTVHLGGRLSPLPAQGSVSFIFTPPSGVPPFSSTMKVIPSQNLVTGNYTLEVRAADSLRLTQQGQALTKTTTRAFSHTGFARMEVSPSPLSLDSAQVSLFSSRNLTIRNTSTASDPYTLVVEPAQTSGPPFEIQSNQGDGATLGPGQTLVWVLAFRPTRKGPATGWVRVRSNDPATPDLQVVLTGKGIGEQVLPRVESSVPAANAEATIDQAITVNFSERMIVTSLDTIVSVHSKRANAEFGGSTQFQPLTMTFTPDEWMWPDDTVTLRIRGIITDTNGNRLDGNEDGAETGSPDDDYLLTFMTGPGVFPGDANHDGIVNEADILPLGRFWKLQGPPRSRQYTDFTIQPARGFPTRIAAHADCDGNGIIDSADICPIAEFFDRDTVLPKAIVDQWLSEAQSWSSTVVDELLGALVECESQGQGTAILRETLMAMQSQNPIPIDFALEQNYPNPFNPATVISFSLAEPGEISLDVFDVLGRRVITLASGPWDAGNHRLIWNGRSDDGERVASGLYFYRLQSHKFTQTRKMLLLK